MASFNDVMTSQLLDDFKAIRALHEDVVIKHDSICAEISTIDDLDGVADAVLIMRETADLVQEIKRRIEKTSQIVADATSVIAVMGGDPSLPKGKYAHARIKPTFSAKIPSFSKDPGGYAELCDELGAPMHPLTRLHFPSVTDEITKRIENGETLSPKLQSHQQYSDSKIVATSLPGRPLFDE